MEIELSNEVELIRGRYERRKNSTQCNIYDPLHSTPLLSMQELERSVADLFNRSGLLPLSDKTVLEIGCGTGGILLMLLRFGFSPENMIGSELMEERAAIAIHRLPKDVSVIVGDSSELNLPADSFDVVLQSTVFTSLLDDDFQEKLARKMWSLVKPGGGVLWYDFIYNNPKNLDVKGISVQRISELFPDAEVKVWHLTLAPPISRLVTKIHPSLYTLFNMLPILRTHVLCWIRKV